MVFQVPTFVKSDVNTFLMGVSRAQGLTKKVSFVRHAIGGDVGLLGPKLDRSFPLTNLRHAVASSNIILGRHVRVGVRPFLGGKLVFFLITIVLNKKMLQNLNIAVGLTNVPIQVTSTFTIHNNMLPEFFRNSF